MQVYVFGRALPSLNADGEVTDCEFEQKRGSIFFISQETIQRNSEPLFFESPALLARRSGSEKYPNEQARRDY